MDYLYEVVKYNKNLPAMILPQNKPGWRSRTPFHWHKEIELIYMVEGHLDININGKEKSLDDNDLFLCNTEVIHMVDVEDDNRLNRYLVVLLSYDFMRQFCPDFDNFSFNVVRNEIGKAKIIASMQNLLELSEQSNDVFIDLKKYEELLNIYYELLKNCSSKINRFILKAPKNFDNAKIAIEYIGNHYAEDITLNDMAKLVDLSPAYFSKYFKEITGSNFLRYLNFVRLEHAMKDMLNRNMSVTDAAFENGLPNVK